MLSILKFKLKVGGGKVFGTCGKGRRQGPARAKNQKEVKAKDQSKTVQEFIICPVSQVPLNLCDVGFPTQYRVV